MAARVNPVTLAHRGGSGPPLVLLHGFLDTWRTWQLVLPALERRHDVLAPTLAGHLGGPPLSGEAGEEAVIGAVERAMEEAGLERAHLAGNSLGGYLSLKLAERGRAESVVALAPAGGWAAGDESYKDLLRLQARMREQAKAIAPRADALLRTPEGRRQATRFITERFEHMPADLIAHQILAVAGAPAALPLIESAMSANWNVHAERIECPVRIVWGSEDRLLPWPSAAARYREDWLPHADWVELEGVGHCPQLDVPEVTAALILERG